MIARGTTAALVAALTVAGATAGNVRGQHNDRMLQTSTVTSTDLGCFRDSKTDRQLEQGLMNDLSMTPKVCFDYCLGKGSYLYYGLQWGKECWCGLAGQEYDGLGALDMSSCAYACPGDSSETCGGLNSFHLYEYSEEPKADGYLNCYADTRADRILSSKSTNSALTPESCKATCEADPTNAYWGLQWSKECWCGPATDDISKHGISDACGYRCAGDVASICGGSFAMDVFSIDGVEPPVTPSPVTPATTSPVTVTTAPATAATPSPVTPATTSPVTVTTAPAAAATPSPVTPATTSPVTVTTAPATAATPSPVTPATTSPVTVTTAPATAATPSPVTPATTAPIATTAAPIPEVEGDVLVDLVPCILAPATITEATAGPYMMNIFYQGYWSGTQVILEVPGDDLYSEMTSADDHGLCNAVYVGITPTTAQFTALQLYSATFKVRIVYFDIAGTAENATFQAKLGTQTDFSDTTLFNAERIGFTTDGAATTRIVNSDLQTDPTENVLFTYPVRQIAAVSGVTRVAEFRDASGAPITSSGYESVAMMTYEGPDGDEEMHVFFSIGWFDLGSWAWAHHIAEWATKGVFMGERRFYLGAVVDDLFLKTNEFVYDGDSNEGTEYRCSGSDLEALIGIQDSLNSQYSSSIVTEFAFNGAGILEAVDSPYLPPYEETIVTVKGTKMTEPGLQPLVIPEDYLSTNVPLMQAEYDNLDWSGDDLLAAVQANPDSFYHGSHTLTHLSRDELQQSDCYAEDGVNAQIAVITGMFDFDTYNWRSMVSPGITGLFNANCLRSGAANLMTCYPGDNTYDGVQTDVSLVSDESQFHSIYTTEAANGYAGMQIVPRFATFVYFNCVSGTCLINENEYIRRFVCGCSNLDPSNPDRGTCSEIGVINGCNSEDDITSFSDIDEVFEAEATTTTRYMLMGRRDKYMFHQANIIPASDLDGKSTLERWYEDVMATLSSYITFPVKSTKFDDLCVNFQEHETLDAAGAVVTATVAADGSISSMTLDASSDAGLIPVTVPTASASSISLGGLAAYDTETFGTDTTYYFANGATPTPAPKPDASELAPIAISSPPAAAPISSAEEEELDLESEEAKEVNGEIAAEQGFVTPDQALAVSSSGL